MMSRGLGRPLSGLGRAGRRARQHGFHASRHFGDGPDLVAIVAVERAGVVAKQVGHLLDPGAIVEKERDGAVA